MPSDPRQRMSLTPPTVQYQQVAGCSDFIPSGHWKRHWKPESLPYADLGYSGRVRNFRPQGVLFVWLNSYLPSKIS